MKEQTWWWNHISRFAVLAEKDRQLDDLNSLKNEVMEMKNSINSRVEESEKMEKLIREKQTGTISSFMST